MTEAPKRPYRHPTYQTAYRVKNGRAYEQSVRDRGDLTRWISPEAMVAWRAPMTGKRGAHAQPIDADIAIETALALRLLFHLPLRQTEGFLGSVLRLRGLALPYPDHPTLSRRHATVVIRRQDDHAPQGPIALSVDGTGLKVCGQGKWQSQQHGEQKARRWKTLPIGVDAQGRLVASTVTASPEQDPSHVLELLAHVDGVIDRLIGDGICDHAPVSPAVENHASGARILIPPRKDAVLSSMASIAPPQHDQHGVAMESAGRYAWKRMSGYSAQSQAENACSRCKRTFGDGLRSKRDASQERAAVLACALLNRMRERGRPQSYAVS